MSEAIDLLRPWIDKCFGNEVTDPAERIAAFQALLPGRLPEDYVTTLLHYRMAIGLVRDAIVYAIGKAPPRDPRQFTYMGDEPSFDVLYGLQSNLANVFDAWDSFQFRMPPGLVPIGDQGMGDQICIDVSEAGNGRICMWGHEDDPGPADAQGRSGWANTFLLATSFTDLIRRLRKDDPLPDDAPVGRICYVRP